ncbi:MAG: hypothetical protein Q9213_007174 [Squamulea squamosa]
MVDFNCAVHAVSCWMPWWRVEDVDYADMASLNISARDHSDKIANEELKPSLSSVPPTASRRHDYFRRLLFRTQLGVCFVNDVVNDADSTDLDSSAGINNDHSTVECQLQFPYSAIESTILDYQDHYALVYTLKQAPKVWLNGVRAFGLDSSTSCQDYYFKFKDRLKIPRVLDLERNNVLPQCSLYPILTYRCGVPLDQQFDQSDEALELSMYNFGFAVEFQLKKLTQNGFLPPRSVLQVVDHVSVMQNEYGPIKTVAAVRRLCQHLPCAGPLTKASELDPLAVAESLDRYIEDMPEEQASHHNESIAMIIYRAVVTPTTMQLVEPDLESNNRVTRKYSKFSYHLLRVTFMGEDGEPFHSDRSQSNRDIFNGRFSGLLQDGIKIGGRLYEFLGFLHSSLRAQACWFLTPFI